MERKKKNHPRDANDEKRATTTLWDRRTVGDTDELADTHVERGKYSDAIDHDAKVVEPASGRMEVLCELCLERLSLLVDLVVIFFGKPARLGGLVFFGAVRVCVFRKGTVSGTTTTTVTVTVTAV